MVTCHPACLLTLHCALSRRPVNGILQVPHHRLWLLREMARTILHYNHSKLASTPRSSTMHSEVVRMYTDAKCADPAGTCFLCVDTFYITCWECKVLHCSFLASIVCRSKICVGLCQFFAANLAAATVAAFAAVVAADDGRHNTHPSCGIRRKLYAVPPEYPQNADGRRKNDQEYSKVTKNLVPSCTGRSEKKQSLGCTMKHTQVGNLRHTSTNDDLMFKGVFCNYSLVVGPGFFFFVTCGFCTQWNRTNVGRGPFRTLSLSLVLFS